MKSLLLLSLICQLEDLSTIQIHIHHKKHKSLDTVEYFKPNYQNESTLEATYSSVNPKQRKIKYGQDQHQLVYVTKLPDNGNLSVSMNLELNLGIGSIRLPGDDEQFQFLKNCQKIEAQKELIGE
ncbi:MAG: hypothetical protein KA715_11410 [Xanthomonadaceae bacterium]|nr:hypothetical protein [Xanthomonadaceae bacterium]